MTTSQSVRAATGADLDDIVRIFLACWRTSYAATMPSRLVTSMTDDRARALWSRVIDEAGPGELLLTVDDVSGVPLAVTRFGRTGAGEGVVQSLYVDPAAQGRGVGRRLLHEATERLRDLGVGTARLWVFRDNAPSRRFYAAQGWTEDGTERVQDEFGDPEVRLALALGPMTHHPALAAAVDRILAPGAAWTPPSGAAIVVRTPAGTFGHAAGDRVPATGESSPLPMTTSTVHDLASVTKVITTTMCQRLVSDGRLDLDDDVRRYVPTFTHAATIRQLLLHRPGLWEWWPLYIVADHPAAAYQVLDSLPLRYQPDSGRHYSDLGFMLLGRVVAAVTGSGLREAVHDLVAEPMGLHTIGYGPRPDTDIAASSFGDVVEQNMLATSAPYPVPFGPGDMDRWRDGLVVGQASDGNAFHALAGVSGHAGLFASAPELLEFASTVSNVAGSRLWDPATARSFAAEGPDAGQALGWRTDTLRIGADAGPLLYHPGYTGTTVGLVPDRGVAFVVATNRLVTSGEPVSNDHIRQIAVSAVEELLADPTSTRTKPTRYS